MAAVCQFHQHGHCKFADKCDKIHTNATCDSFPCQDYECPKRHPRMCKYYALYGRCVYAERCSFLHFRLNIKLDAIQLMLNSLKVGLAKVIKTD